MEVAKSRLYIARKGTGSLKTTIPEKVVRLLKMRPGDELEWELWSDGSTFIKVRKKAAAGHEAKT